MLLRIYLRFWKPIVKKRKIFIVSGKIRCNKKSNGGYFWCQGTEAISENMFFLEKKNFQRYGRTEELKLKLYSLRNKLN